ncbi:MAG: hypothetical protein JWP59_4480, partial [Massilia sp.]|nr:hypothetical protein [Massilia sp.]
MTAATPPADAADSKAAATRKVIYA